jgi:hypothetical protein
MGRTPRRLLLPLLLLAIVGVVLVSLATGMTPIVRDRVVSALNARFESDVQIDSLQVGAFPRPELSGAGLTVRWEGRTDVPPLVKIGEFGASAGLFGLLGTPMRLKSVELDRLELHIPPGGVKGVAGSESTGTSGSEEASSADGGSRLAIDEIVAHAAQLQIASKEPGKLPRVFDIHDLHINGFGEQNGAAFHALLTNPKPEGRITTNGRFGPWHKEEPRKTPVRGEYKFEHADLGTIKGLGGILSSRGTYSGPLERIEVAGQTETPDFSIDVAGHRVPLTTRFKAIVDGTNGNTWLEQVDARLMESHIHARGAVVRTQDVKGRKVELDIRIDNARIEDLLKLAMKGSKPPLIGAVKVNTKFLLPVGKEDVIERLRLAGDFALEQARFTNFNVQKRISGLSQRGRGDETPDDGESVVSQLRGRFALTNASLTFSNLTFAVPGAAVELAGSYHLQSEALDFAGHLLLDASLRDTTSGAKAVLATIAQPFFRRPGGGSKLPIRVGGTRAKPEFGLDVKKALLPG